MDLQEHRLALQKKLTENGFETPGNVSLVLICHALKRPKTWVLTHGEYILKTSENHALQSSVERLLQGVPLPYVLGEWEFFGRPFEISPAVLIPRPETELLVERAIHLAAGVERPLIVDVGSGSGIIGISIAAALPQARVLAIDLSRPALEITRRNAIRHRVNMDLLQADLLQPLNGKFDLICANPPYIPTETLKQLDIVEWEPKLALDGGDSGLSIIQKLLMQANTHLAPGGTFLMEIEATLGQETLLLARKAFPNADSQLFSDLAGKDRLIRIHLN